MSPAGRAITVWSLQNRTDPVVQAASRPAGGAFAASVDLSTAGESADGASVAVNDAGDAIVGWLRSGAADTIVQVALRAGSGSFSSEPLDLTTAGNASSVRVAINPAGDMVAAWRRLDGAHYIVQAAVRPAGGSFSPTASLSAAGASASLGDVAIDAAGNALVVWDRPSGAGQLVQLARRPAGGGFAAATDLTPADKTAYAPTLALDPAGQVIVAWLIGADAIVQARAGTTGGTFEAPADLSATGHSAGSPDLALDASGRAIAAWQRPDGTRSVVQAARYAVLPPPAPPPPPPPPPLPPAAQQPPAPPAADVTPPAVTLSGSRLQKLGSTVFVDVLCPREGCRTTLSGTVRVARIGAFKARTYRLKAVTRAMAQGSKARIALKLPAVARTAIGRALRARRATVVKLRIRALDAAGNARTLTREVRLRR